MSDLHACCRLIERLARQRGEVVVFSVLGRDCCVARLAVLELFPAAGRDHVRKEARKATRPAEQARRELQVASTR